MDSFKPNVPIAITNDSQLKQAKMSVGRFIYANGLDFGAVNSPSFQTMINNTYGLSGRQIPSCEELKGWIFQDVMKEVHEHVHAIKSSWVEAGCSVILDEWKDANGRNLVIVLADSPKGTIYIGSSDITDSIGNMEAMQFFFGNVVAEVGIQNVVQVVTNSAHMREVGQHLPNNYRAISWTLSSSYCIELMLEKLKEMHVFKETLNKAKMIERFILSHPGAMQFLRDHGIEGTALFKPSKIRSIQQFLALENMVIQKQMVKTMLLSHNRISGILTSTMEGEMAAKLVADKTFWTDASIVLNGAIPLVRVIECTHGDSRELNAYIYETIDQAKETIKKGLKNKDLYVPIWKAIDDVWNGLLYSPLHSTAYFLNPYFFYSKDLSIDAEVVTGVLHCVVRSTSDTRVQDRLVAQLDLYKNMKGEFKAGSEAVRNSHGSPARWWSEYSGECPDLQRLAIRILSQTCDGASKFGLKRSWAEKLHVMGGGGDRVEHKRLADMAFARYNMQLMNFASRNTH